VSYGTYGTTMTRRDYCSECSEMVSDGDVQCVKCGDSQCFCCIATYDYKTELCALVARFNVLSVPYILVEELEQLRLNIAINRSENDQTHRSCCDQELCSAMDAVHLESHCGNLVAQYQVKYQNADPKTKITDPELINSLLHYFNSINDYYLENYVCYDCHHDMKNTKKIARLESEIVRLRGKIKELKIRLDEYSGSEESEEEED
jgi:hypothetical protein